MNDQVSSPSPASDPQPLEPAPSVTLPKGGGAIRGIGEKFAVPAPATTAANLDGFSLTSPDLVDPSALTDGPAVGRLTAKSLDTDLLVKDDAADAEWKLAVGTDDVAAFRSTVKDIFVVWHYSITVISRGN